MKHAFVVTITFTNDNPATIWNRLAVELGREPTHREACDRVRRILKGESAEGNGAASA